MNLACLSNLTPSQRFPPSLSSLSRLVSFAIHPGLVVSSWLYLYVFGNVCTAHSTEDETARARVVEVRQVCSEIVVMNLVETESPTSTLGGRMDGRDEPFIFILLAK